MMCLDKPVNEKPCEEGYKVFTKFDNYITSDIRNSARLPLGEWLVEKDYRHCSYQEQDNILYGDVDYFISTALIGHGYPMGWHVFHKLEDAKRWIINAESGATKTIRRVVIEEPVAVGVQERIEGETIVTVCKKIKILEEVV